MISQTPLFKTMLTIFVFLVLTTALSVVVVDHFLNLPDDPRVVGLLQIGLGYALNQIGNYQGSVNEGTQQKAREAIAPPAVETTRNP